MGIIRGSTTQSGVDTFTQTAIDTNLDADGRTGWNILGVEAYYSNGETVAAADSDVSLILSTRATTVTTFDESEEIARINWAVANTGGVAVAYPLELIKRSVVFPRLTVQPTIYVGVSSTLSGIANIVFWHVEYELVKLSDIEVLRLLVGGA